MRICHINGAFKELLILKVLFEHQLINFHRVPLKERQLRYPQFIDWRNRSLDLVQETQQSVFGRFLTLGLCYYSTPVPTQNVVKSTLKKRNIGMHRGGRAFFFHLMQKYLCVKSHLSQINHYCLVTESKPLSVLVSYNMDILLTLPGYSPFSGHVNTLIRRYLGALFAMQL